MAKKKGFGSGGDACTCLNGLVVLLGTGNDASISVFNSSLCNGILESSNPGCMSALSGCAVDCSGDPICISNRQSCATRAQSQFCAGIC